MILALLMTVVVVTVVWLVFFKFKWLKWSIAWAVVSSSAGLHVLLVFMIGMRFSAPYSSDGRIIQPTIQLVPRLSEPTLVTAVLVEPNARVKKGQPLFQFDRRPYAYKVAQLEAELAKAKQDVQMFGADIAVNLQKVEQAKAELEYATYQQKMSARLSKTGAGPVEEAQKYMAEAKTKEASVKEAEAEVVRARLRYQSQIGGVNTTVAAVQSQLDQARYFLDNTTLVAPEDGKIVNLQVRAGMVSGDYRLGAIASLICDADRYMLATFNQEVLKFVKVGQPTEVALELYPGQIFDGTLLGIWPSGEGQLLPSGTLPKFVPPAPEAPQGRFAAAIRLTNPDQSLFPIGAQGTAAIYTGSRAWGALRKVSIRTKSWLNWLYPLPF